MRTSGQHIGEKTHVLDKHEALGVGDDLGSVKSLLEVVDELLLVAAEAGLGALENLGSTATLLLERTQATGEDSLADKGDGHSEVESVDGSPLTGSLLTGRVHNLLEKRRPVVIVEVQNVAGDFNEEGV